MKELFLIIISCFFFLSATTFIVFDIIPNQKIEVLKNDKVIRTPISKYSGILSFKIFYLKTNDTVIMKFPYKKIIEEPKFKVEF